MSFSDKFSQFGNMRVEDIANQMNSTAGNTEPLNAMPNVLANQITFAPAKPESKPEDFLFEAEVFVGLFDNGIAFGMPLLLKKVYNLPSEDEAEHLYRLHNEQYAEFKDKLAVFEAQEEQGSIEKEQFSTMKQAYEAADENWKLYPLLKRAVEQKGLDDGERSLMKKAIATWLYNNRDKPTHIAVTMLVVALSSVGSRFAYVEANGIKKFKPVMVDENKVLQLTAQKYEQQQEKFIFQQEPPSDGGGLLESSLTEEPGLGSGASV